MRLAAREARPLWEPATHRSDAEAFSSTLNEALGLIGRSARRRASRTNLLVFVDQFEEIFRFRDKGASHRDESDAFIALLLDTAAQREMPVYVAITMRSDYLGHCAVFAGLPEAMNKSQYLTPRLTREQRQMAMIGPARVFDADLEPTLVNRLLNDMGSDPNQLPLCSTSCADGRATVARVPVEWAPDAPPRCKPLEARDGVSTTQTRRGTLETDERRRSRSHVPPPDRAQRDQRDTPPCPLLSGSRCRCLRDQVGKSSRRSGARTATVTPRVGETLCDHPPRHYPRKPDQQLAASRCVGEAEGKSAETYRLLEQSARRWKAANGIVGHPTLTSRSVGNRPNPTQCRLNDTHPHSIWRAFLDESQTGGSRCCRASDRSWSVGECGSVSSSRAYASVLLVSSRFRLRASCSRRRPVTAFGNSDCRRAAGWLRKQSRAAPPAGSAPATRRETQARAWPTDARNRGRQGPGGSACRGSREH